MKYQNPIVKGFNPDPSICKANGKYYLVTSTFQFFPGVPVYESDDLVNWELIGHCLTRKSQLNLEGSVSSGGIYAPTIRYHEGRFYMTTTNSTTQQNFIVYTDDIYGEWSEPVFIEQGGIDPSLYFEDGKVYFMSNGTDDFGNEGITQCEINILTGEKLSPSKSIWQGSGGRYLEGPHLYKINGIYYLVASEGGTEYGHMLTYAIGDNPYGPFTNYPKNPVLTNRNLGGFQIQAVGHGDLIEDNDGNWHLVHLAFRQIDRWLPFHHLGRETFLVPVSFDQDGWFTCGLNGTTEPSYEIKGDFIQKEVKTLTFENTDIEREWIYLRNPNKQDYNFTHEKVTLKGNQHTLDEFESPTFLGIRQTDFDSKIETTVSIDHGLAGLTIFMDDLHHYDLYIEKANDQYRVVGKINIGPLKQVVSRKYIQSNEARLIITSDALMYRLYIDEVKPENELAFGQTRYLSSEVAGGFTGVMIGIYAISEKEGNQAVFKNFKISY